MNEVESSQMICNPLTKLQCCPTSDGAACAIFASEAFVKKNKLENQAVEVLSCILGSDKRDSYSTNSSIDLIGGKLAKR